MEIKKRNRSELKSFFVKNAIPTEGEFAELIEGMLNQKDDGLAKLPGSPLSIEASGDAASQKKVLNFYKNISNADPDWVLSLNPRSDPAKPATAKPGFSISDHAGNSRLFIDQSTGHIGLGTVDPGAKLDIQASTQTVGGWFEGIRMSRPEHSAITHPSGGLLFGLHKNRNFYFGDIQGGALKKYVLQINADSGDVLIPGTLSFGSSVRQMLNLYGTNYGVGIQSSTQYFRSAKNFAWYKGGAHNNAELNPGGGTAQMVIKNGNVCIGANNPGAKLDVRGNIFAGNSDIYFTKTDHNHTGTGNTAGYAAIENAVNYDALMILGRAGTTKGRSVKLWDFLQVNGNMEVTGGMEVAGWIEQYGRKGRYKAGTVPGNGNWQRIVTKLNGHQGFELVADISKSGRHGLTHAICLSTYVGAGSNGGITKTMTYYGSANGRIDVRWTGTTYNYNLEIRTLENYGAGKNITYHLTKLW